MMKVFAHRGASAAAQENTLEAFRVAGELGADGVEMDVRRTADDVLVVHHDAHLPDGRAIVELPGDDLPDWVPTLAEALEVCRDLMVNIEIKSAPSDPDYDAEHQVSVAVAGLMLAHRPSGDVLVSSFDMEAINRIKALDPGIATAFLTFEVMAPNLLVDRVASAGHNAVHPYVGSTDAALVRTAHDAGLQVNVWTVNDPDRMVTLAAMGVDGVITDVPDVARAALTDS